MGGVIGIDMPAYLEIAREQGYETQIMVILLPFAEAGLIQAIGKKSKPEEDDGG